MSSPRDKGPYPPEYASDLRRNDLLTAADLFIEDPSALPDLDDHDPARVEKLYNVLTQYRWAERIGATNGEDV